MRRDFKKSIIKKSIIKNFAKVYSQALYKTTTTE